MREAFIRLVGEKLVEVRPQRGTYLRKIDVAEVEAGIARLAACCTDAAAVAELRRQMTDQAEVAQEGGRSFVQLDELLHRTLAETAGRAGAWVHLQPIKMHMDRVRHLTAVSFRSTGWSPSIRE